MHSVNNSEPAMFKVSSDLSLIIPRPSRARRNTSSNKIAAAKTNGSKNALLSVFPPNELTKTNHKQIGAPLEMTKSPVSFFLNSHNAIASPTVTGTKYSSSGINIIGIMLMDSVAQQYSLSQTQTPETNRVTGALSARLNWYRLKKQGKMGFSSCRIGKWCLGSRERA